MVQAIPQEQKNIIGVRTILIIHLNFCCVITILIYVTPKQISLYDLETMTTKCAASDAHS